MQSASCGSSSFAGMESRQPGARCRPGPWQTSRKGHEPASEVTGHCLKLLDFRTTLKPRGLPRTARERIGRQAIGPSARKLRRLNRSDGSISIVFSVSYKFKGRPIDDRGPFISERLTSVRGPAWPTERPHKLTARHLNFWAVGARPVRGLRGCCTPLSSARRATQALIRSTTG